MGDPAGRRVRLLVVGPDGEYRGALPEYDVPVPWWPETESVQEEARGRFGAEVTVVRLVDTERPAMPGGTVIYLAEAAGRPAGLEPRTDSLAAYVAGKVAEDQPHRMWWARPGGVARAVAWAREALAASGREPTGPAVQVKSWNLSLVLRLPTSLGPVWLKATPPFMAHEGAALELAARADADLVPRLLARDPDLGVVLMDDLPGEDRWGAGPDERAALVRRLVAVQAAWSGRADELVAAGIPRAPLAGLASDLAEVLGRPEVEADLSASERRRLDAIVAGLPALASRVADCGVPDTLVHGDFHPGNCRGQVGGEGQVGGDGRPAAVLDWGDSHVGQPLVDVLRMADWQDAPGQPPAAEPTRAAGVRAWQEAVPGSDPARALELLAPLGPLRGAVVYQRFVDGIEDDERRYHAADVTGCLRAALLRT